MTCQSKGAELFLLPHLVITFLFQGGYQEHNKFYFLTAHGGRLGQKQKAIPTYDGNKVAVEQCSLLRSQMLFLGKNGVLYGGVLGESEE